MIREDAAKDRQYLVLQRLFAGNGGGVKRLWRDKDIADADVVHFTMKAADGSHERVVLTGANSGILEGLSCYSQRRT